MKKIALYIGLTAFFVVAAFGPAGADSDHEQPMAESEHESSHDSVDHSGHVGERIHVSTVEGFTLAYHLLDLPGKAARHLMVYIQDPDGNGVSGGEVGYLVSGPGGRVQKVMAMAMKEAFGGDVDFTASGEYDIKVKAVIGEKKLIDAFRYSVP